MTHAQRDSRSRDVSEPERLTAYRLQVRDTFRSMSDRALAFQDGVVVGGIDRDELERELERRRSRRSHLTQTHVRMNDYVGPGRYATIAWAEPCSSPSGQHAIGLLGHTCSTCQAAPTTITYE